MTYFTQIDWYHIISLYVVFEIHNSERWHFRYNIQLKVSIKPTVLTVCDVSYRYVNR